MITGQGVSIEGFPITQQIKRLNAAVDNLDSEIQNISARLQPILKQPSPESAKPTVSKDSVESPLGSELRSAAMHVESLAETVLQLILRLEC